MAMHFSQDLPIRSSPRDASGTCRCHRVASAHGRSRKQRTELGNLPDHQAWLVGASNRRDGLYLALKPLFHASIFRTEKIGSGARAFALFRSVDFRNSTRLSCARSIGNRSKLLQRSKGSGFSNNIAKAFGI